MDEPRLDMDCGSPDTIPQFLRGSGSSVGTRCIATRLPKGLLNPSKLLRLSRAEECQGPRGAHQYLQQAAASHTFQCTACRSASEAMRLRAPHAMC